MIFGEMFALSFRHLQSSPADIRTPALMPACAGHPPQRSARHEQRQSTGVPRLFGHPREGKDDYWLNIGLAFPHGDGKGFNVMLQALPLNAKLVLREVAEEERANARSEPDNRQERRGEGRDNKTTGGCRPISALVFF